MSSRRNAFVASFPVAGRAKARALHKAVLGLALFCATAIAILFIHSFSLTPALTAKLTPVTAQKPNVANTSNSSSTTSPSSSAATPVSVTKKAKTVAIPSAPSCATGVSNPQPSALNINDATGLKKIIDTPASYAVYGYSAGEVQNQVFSCTPVTEGSNKFAASTNYIINWSFNYSSTDGYTTCSVANAVVGVHVTQIYPEWIDSPYATSGYAGRWNTFIANLHTHENGHRDLDIQYAAKLLNDLQNMPATSCNNLLSAVTTVANADLAQLNQANNSYDAQTNHGATQGAVIPRS